jgi:hypothetical protein
MPVLIGRARRKRARGAATVSSLKRAPAKTAGGERYVTWSLRLPFSLHYELKQLAKDQGRSANKQVEMLIRRALADRLTQVTAEDPAVTADN